MRGEGEIFAVLPLWHLACNHVSCVKTKSSIHFPMTQQFAPLFVVVVLGPPLADGSGSDFCYILLLSCSCSAWQFSGQFFLLFCAAIAF